MKFLNVTNNITLEKLCRQPDMLGKPVLGISPSGFDKIKVSIGRIDKNGNYLEMRDFVFNSSEDAIEYAKARALVVDTNFIYEIRIFKDCTSECIRILQDEKVESNKESELTGNAK